MEQLTISRPTAASRTPCREALAQRVADLFGRSEDATTGWLEKRITRHNGLAIYYWKTQPGFIRMQVRDAGTLEIRFRIDVHQASGLTTFAQCTRGEWRQQLMAEAF
jgi:hypothetical protein